jgi:hypothetical protein
MEQKTGLRSGVRRAHALVVEWASLHKDELMKNWDRCQVPAPAIPIEPLE